IGQYENSSDPTSWDWVEQKRGVYAIAPEVDDYVDSLLENGVQVQVQLMYGNPMYTSDCRTSIALAPGRRFRGANRRSRPLPERSHRRRAFVPPNPNWWGQNCSRIVRCGSSSRRHRTCG